MASEAMRALIERLVTTDRIKWGLLGLLFGSVSAGVFNVSLWRYSLGSLLTLLAFKCYREAGILRDLW